MQKSASSPAPQAEPVTAPASTESRTSRTPNRGSAANAADLEDVVTHLRRTTGGNEKLIRSLAETFLADAPKTLALIRAAIAKEDHTKLASASHLLKGSIAIFGAPKAVAAARNLEAMGRGHNVGDAEGTLHALESEFTILQQELQVIQSAPEPDMRRKSQPRAPSAVRPRRKFSCLKQLARLTFAFCSPTLILACHQYGGCRRRPIAFQGDRK